jgi:hypothetical protein
LNILFYDDRNTTSDSTGVFLARSEDGGEHWSEFQISDNNFKPNPVIGTSGSMGDFISITSNSGKLSLMWMDNRTGVYQIWSAIIDYSTLGVEEFSKQIHNYRIAQNFPNPFNPSTNIKYSIPELSNVVIKVFDILGNEIETLVNEEKPIGTYEVKWDAKNNPSGIYFYRIIADNFIETKKMVLME